MDKLVDHSSGPFEDTIGPTLGFPRGCPLDVTEDPDLSDYSNEGDALIIEEVGNVR